MKSKTIILSIDNEKGRGILTLFQEDDLLQCRIRLYNMPKLSRYCKLGIYHDKQVYSANLLEKNGVYTSSMVGNFDIDQDFYAAIIDTANENKVILSGGTYAGFFFNEQPIFESELNSNNFQPAEIDENLNLKEETNQHIFDVVSKAEPNTNLYSYKKEDTLDYGCDSENEKCKNCKYKEFFYSQNSQFENEQNDLLFSKENKDEQTSLAQQLNIQPNKSEIYTDETTQNQNNKTKTILESLIPQFQYVFENYPKDETLNNLIPNSKFVKIEENESSYSIGAIYDEEQMKYICYAVLCNYNSPAPEELGKHYQWLPLDKEDPLSEGYYIVFQDAIDLKIVEL